MTELALTMAPDYPKVINAQTSHLHGRRTHCLTAVCAAIALWSSPSYSADHNAGIWTVFTATNTIFANGDSTRWSYWLDAHLRYFDIGSGANQELIRPAIGYQVRDNLQLWVGYGRFRTRSVTGSVGFENRFFQQANWSVGRLAGGTVSMRLRLLQRNLSTGDDVGIAVRFLAKYTRALGDDGQRNLILSVEPFVDLRDTDWGADAGFSQYRAYVGIGWRVGEAFTLETGYMNQFLVRDNREDISNHLAVLNFRAKF